MTCKKDCKLKPICIRYRAGKNKTKAEKTCEFFIKGDIKDDNNYKNS